MWALKLGGSLCHTQQLLPWLEAIAALPEAPLVVPGGGPFADSVREAQRRWGFGDAAAHHMAVLGMEQMAHMLCALQPRFEAVASDSAIHMALRSGRVPVWLPARMLQGAADVATDWDVTSDSLAAWLAGRLHARALVLVKSADLDAGRTSIARLQRDGVLDRAFQRFHQAGSIPTLLLNRHQYPQLAELLQRGMAGHGCASLRGTAGCSEGSTGQSIGDGMSERL
jgi:aspartokinase-like uncharacterized kinase